MPIAFASRATSRVPTPPAFSAGKGDRVIESTSAATVSVNSAAAAAAPADTASAAEDRFRRSATVTSTGGSGWKLTLLAGPNREGDLHRHLGDVVLTAEQQPAPAGPVLALLILLTASVISRIVGSAR